MGITEKEALKIIETAIPDITYREMMNAIKKLIVAGIIINTDVERCDNFQPNQKKTIADYEHHATPAEIAEWEKYNGKGSYNSNAPLKCDSKPVKVTNEKIFKSIFVKPKTDFIAKEDEDFPF